MRVEDSQPRTQALPTSRNRVAFLFLKMLQDGFGLISGNNG